MAAQFYKKNFLTDVLFKINFSILLSLNNETPEEFQKKIIEDFPVLEPIQGVDIKIDLRLQSSTSTPIPITWTFSNTDKSFLIELTSSSLAVINKKYKNIETFNAVVSKILNAFFSVYSQVLITRVGLRYINQIKLDEKDFFEWKNYLNGSLISHLSFIEKPEVIRRSFNRFDLKIDDDTNLLFQYGIHNETFPEKITKKEFALDFDCYSQIQVEKEQVMAKLDEFHKIIKDFFEKSIEDGFRKKLDDK